MFVQCMLRDLTIFVQLDWAQHYVGFLDTNLSLSTIIVVKPDGIFLDIGGFVVLKHYHIFPTESTNLPPFKDFIDTQCIGFKPIHWHS